jgi:hypothetical protein
MPAHADFPRRALSERDFRRELEGEIMRARRGSCPLSVAAFALDGARGPDDEAGLLRRIREMSNPCDTPGQLSGGSCALILPGAGIFKAQSLVEGMIRSLGDAGFACSAGIAGADAGECPDADVLLRGALKALKAAGKSAGKILVRRERHAGASLSETLVRPDEKRFLFSGG